MTHPSFLSAPLPRRTSALILRRSPCCSARPARKPRTSPPSAFGLLASSARVVWDGVWRLMMAQLAPSDASGAYERPASAFLSGSSRMRGTPTVFIGAACGWCHRVMLARALLGLHDALRVVRLEPGRDGLWRVAETAQQARWGRQLRDVYLTCSDGKYAGRSTAPLLVAATENDAEIVSNESSDILQIMPTVFGVDGAREIADGVVVWLGPAEGNAFGVDPAEVEEVCRRVYEDVNNGVYKCGFATTQAAYEKAERSLFEALDAIEMRLARTRFLCSAEVVTEADVRLFPTVFRFDAVYGRLFRAGRKSIEVDYPSISGWMRDLYAMPGVKETCDLEATLKNYYTSLFMLNPGGIVPLAREVDLGKPHEREGLGKVDSGVLAA